MLAEATQTVSTFEEWTIVFAAGGLVLSLLRHEKSQNGIGRKLNKVLAYLIEHAPDAAATKELTKILRGD